MGNRRLEQESCRWHLLSLAFDGYEGWRKALSDLGISVELTEQEYEDLFFGTNADLYLPLWASACIKDGDALQNAVTKDLAIFYKKAGYTPAYLQNNPLDYIGEQCRFLEYLTSLACYGDETALLQAKQFIAEFLEETVFVLKKEIERSGILFSDVSAVLRVLTQAVSGSSAEGNGSYRPQFQKRGVCNIPEPEKRVCSASFSDCGRKCKLVSKVQEGCVLSIGPDTAYREKRFQGCIRGHQYRQTYLTPHRLRYPMVRRGKRGEGLFKRISWEEAIDLMAEKMKETLDDHGPGSRFVMHSAGVCAALRGDRLMKDLLALQGGYQEFYNFYSASCAEHVLPYVYGTIFCGNHDQELLNAEMIVLWGHNPADTIWGKDHLTYLAKAKEKGIPIIVIDPRRSTTAKVYADQWIAIRPGTDGALADALACEIVQAGLHDQEFLDRFCIGFDAGHMPEQVPKEENYKDYLFGKNDGVRKDALWGEAITGIDHEVIRSFARELASKKPVCILPGLGPQRTLNGEQNCRSTAMLACITGNVGISGGGAGAFQMHMGHRVPYFAWRENPYPGMIPSFLWTKAIEKPETIRPDDGLIGREKLESGLKLIFNLAGGMLLNQHSDINETIRVLKQEDKAEMIVVSDLFYTPGARYADLLLPGVSFFETENIMGAWMNADYFLYDEPAIAPLFEGRFEYDWIVALSEKLGVKEAFTRGRSKQDWLKALYEENGKYEKQPDFETFKKEGIVLMKDPGKETVAFAKQIREGIPFDTPSGKIELFSERLYERKDPRLPGIPCYTPCEEGYEDPLRKRYPIQLVGYHSKRYCHSIGDQNTRLDAVQKPCLYMNEADASVRGIQDGDLCEVFNDRGRIRIAVSVSDDMIKGSAALCEGGWYTPDPSGTDRRGCINVLTMSHRTTPLAKANPQHTNLVEIVRCNYDE